MEKADFIHMVRMSEMASADDSRAYRRGVAAFAALVANDLISPGAFDAGLWPGLIPWVAAAGVVVVAIKTKSMLWCCVSGIVLYIVLSLL